MLRLESLKQENREIKKPRKQWLSCFRGRDFCDFFFVVYVEYWFLTKSQKSGIDCIISADLSQVFYPLYIKLRVLYARDIILAYENTLSMVGRGFY